MKKLQFEDMIELAANLCGLDAEASETEVETALWEKFNITSEDFEVLVQKLFELLDYSVSPLTSTPMIGFGTGQMWLLKKEVEVGKFISNLIQWITDGDDPKKGFVKPIIEGGILKYNLYLVKSEYKVSIKKEK
jgi:hypothetical protein